MSELTASLAIDYQPSDVLVKRVDSEQSFIQVQKWELEQIKNDIFKSLIDLRAEVYHDEKEKVERQMVIDKQMATISILEVKIHDLELECQRVNKIRLKASRAVESERMKLREEVEDLLDYQRKMEERRLIREMVYGIAMPNEMFNFQKIEDVMSAHQREIERLERMKIGCTPSEIELINKQIAEFEMKFNEQLNTMSFQCDENGRKFYYDRNGVKTYLDEFRVFMDELGDYIIDADGNKSYVRKYAHDEFGRYYLDENDNRIYKATPHSPGCILINGVLVRIRENPEEISPSSNDEKTQESEDDSLPIKTEYLNLLLGSYAEPLKKALLDCIWKCVADPIDHIQKYFSDYEKKKLQRSVHDKFLTNLAEKRRAVARESFD